MYGGSNQVFNRDQAVENQIVNTVEEAWFNPAGVPVTLGHFTLLPSTVNVSKTLRVSYKVDGREDAVHDFSSQQDAVKFLRSKLLPDAEPVRNSPPNLVSEGIHPNRVPVGAYNPPITDNGSGNLEAHDYRPAEDSEILS